MDVLPGVAPAWSGNFSQEMGVGRPRRRKPGGHLVACDRARGRRAQQVGRGSEQNTWDHPEALP